MGMDPVLREGRAGLALNRSKSGRVCYGFSGSDLSQVCGVFGFRGHDSPCSDSIYEYMILSILSCKIKLVWWKKVVYGVSLGA